ncbi:Succinate dehydrogenase flavin-adding protein, antitoxin of CptAB toxin-antitoxin [hydrothermal vent metagenome]|uniref:Succinate dehydrogenase flavin-adding protein, antitoxin of CptAB toxin-antitoxin n=1 Tax=hydrothermal vent metagenome TaxID=652676 RepID=A0A3B1B829_9ZZZZ
MNTPATFKPAATQLTLEQELARLRWQCRRGMLELDAMLGSFLDKCFVQLSDKEKRAFYTLLNYPDQFLLEYLMGRSLPLDKDVAHVAQKIQAAAGP